MQTQTETQPHQHHCAARPEIHEPGRESPANRDKATGVDLGIFDPAACTCEKPDVPQCCANHPTANPNYKPRRDLATSPLAAYADEIRGLKERIANIEADNLELKQQVSALTAVSQKFEKYVQ